MFTKKKKIFEKGKGSNAKWGYTYSSKSEWKAQYKGWPKSKFGWKAPMKKKSWYESYYKTN